MKRKIALLLIALLLVLSIQAGARNTEFAPGVDIMFVIDSSFSMGINDPDGMVFEAVKYVAALSEGTQNRIGFVIFTCSIVVEQGLRKVYDSEEIKEVMRELQAAPFVHGTDVGLGVGRAKELLMADNYREGFTAMIILSDGDTVLEVENPRRTQEEVEEEWEYVLNNVSYPVFTIQYSELGDFITDGYRHSGVMDDWGPRTGGRNFDATHPLQLIEAISSIYEEMTGLTLDITDVGERFEVTIVSPEDNQELIEEEELYDELEEEESEPLLTGIQIFMLICAIIGGILITLLAIYQVRQHQHRKRYQYFKGSLECYFMVIPDASKEVPIQSWSAAVIAGKKSGSLYELLKNISLINKMPEAKKVFVEIGQNNSILITNQAGVTCYRNGKEVGDKKISLYSGEGLYMVFQKGTLELELRVRKGSL